MDLSIESRIWGLGIGAGHCGLDWNPQITSNLDLESDLAESPASGQNRASVATKSDYRLQVLKTDNFQSRLEADGQSHFRGQFGWISSCQSEIGDSGYLFAQIDDFHPAALCNFY